MTDSTQDNGLFTMVYHLLAQEIGLVCAAVYGEVKRRCGLQRGVCDASLETLGATIHLDRATVMRSIKKLCELGYLTDQTPGRRNAPHTYTLLKSVAQCNSSMDTDVVTRSDSEAETVAQKNKSVAYNNSSIEDAPQEGKSVAENNATVAESHLRRVLEDSLKDSSPYGEGDKPPPAEKVKTESIPKRPRPEPVPAAKVFVEVTGKFVLNNTQIQEIDKRVGRDPPALEKWREVVTAWQLKGNKINNIDGMLDWFKKGIPVYQNGVKAHGTHQRTNQRGIRALEETGESAKGKRTIDIYTNEYVYPDGHREPVPPVPRVQRPGLLPS